MGQVYNMEDLTDLTGDDNFQVLPACAGPIPKELGALTKLETLELIDNRLTGERR